MVCNCHFSRKMKHRWHSARCLPEYIPGFKAFRSTKRMNETLGWAWETENNDAGMSKSSSRALKRGDEVSPDDVPLEIQVQGEKSLFQYMGRRRASEFPSNSFQRSTSSTLGWIRYGNAKRRKLDWLVVKVGWRKGGDGLIESTTIAKASRGAKMGLLSNNDELEHLDVTRCRQKMLADHGSTEFGPNLKIIRHQVNPNWS